MLQIIGEQKQHINEALRWFDGWFRNFFLRILSEEIPYFQPPREILEVTIPLEKLSNGFRIHDEFTPGIIDEDTLPCLKRILLNYRRSLATEFERHKAKTIHSEVISVLEAHVSPLDKLLQIDWLCNVEPIKLPRLTQFISIEQLERILPRYGRGSKQTPLAQFLKQYQGSEIEVLTTSQSEKTRQEYDEKFHILRAPNLFFQDLATFRYQCEMRNTSVIIAYLDIDDFKSFNTNHSETTVDRVVLPPFMSAIESHTYAHGFAYRFGGDEYVILLLNMAFDIAKSFLDQLRQDLSQVEYRGINEKTTVSIGFCYLAPDCILTDQEALARANNAKQFAKKHGKNCIATFKQERFDNQSLYIVSSGNH